MPAPSRTLLIEGSFTELAEEFAQYIDNIRKSQQNESNLQAEIAPALTELSELQKQEQEDELSPEKNDHIVELRTTVMKTLVVASPALNSAPEKGTMHSTGPVFAIANTYQKLRPPTISSCI